GMSVLVGGRLQKTDGWQCAGLGGAPKIVQIVLMIGLIGFAYVRHGSRRKMMRIGRRCVVLKGLMVRHVVVRRRSGDVGVPGGAVGKATLEPAPGDALVIEQVAHVLARHGDGVVQSGDAVVESRAR